jgi:hypothetical protein
MSSPHGGMVRSRARLLDCTRRLSRTRVCRSSAVRGRRARTGAPAARRALPGQKVRQHLMREQRLEPRRAGAHTRAALREIDAAGSDLGGAGRKAGPAQQHAIGPMCDAVHNHGGNVESKPERKHRVTVARARQGCGADAWPARRAQNAPCSWACHVSRLAARACGQATPPFLRRNSFLVAWTPWRQKTSLWPLAPQPGLPSMANFSLLCARAFSLERSRSAWETGWQLGT